LNVERVPAQAAPDIAKWNNVKRDADDKKRKTPDEGLHEPRPDHDRNGSTTAPPSRPPPQDDGFPFGDPIRMTCLLCQRQFQSVEQLEKHNRLSDLHKVRRPGIAPPVARGDDTRAQGNLANAELVRIGKENKAASLAHYATPAIAAEVPTAGAYRDRAAERRTALGQPERPSADDRAKRARYEPAPPSSSTAAAAPPAIDVTKGLGEDNRGHRMLAAAGWQAGEGLGQGGGRVDPVAARMYAQGAGLGSNAGACRPFARVRTANRS
jgi:RNA-binding protein 5/10